MRVHEKIIAAHRRGGQSPTCFLAGAGDLFLGWLGVSCGIRAFWMAGPPYRHCGALLPCSRNWRQLSTKLAFPPAATPAVACSCADPERTVAQSGRWTRGGCSTLAHDALRCSANAAARTCRLQPLRTALMPAAFGPHGYQRRRRGLMCGRPRCAASSQSNTGSPSSPAARRVSLPLSVLVDVGAAMMVASTTGSSQPQAPTCQMRVDLRGGASPANAE